MAEKESLITKLERGRAEFAYECVLDGKKILSDAQIDGEWYKDDKYKSYVKKIPTMILFNGLGQTLAYITSKRQKIKNDNKQKIQPGQKENPKNAYDLIYKQLTNYLKSNSVVRLPMPLMEKDLIEWVISLDSANYRYVTEEILAFLSWIKKFAEGMIESEEE